MSKKRVIAYFPKKATKAPKAIEVRCNLYCVPNVNGRDPVGHPNFEGPPDLILIFSGCEYADSESLIQYARQCDIPVLHHLSDWNHAISLSNKARPTKWFYDEFQNDLVTLNRRPPRHMRRKKVPTIKKEKKMTTATKYFTSWTRELVAVMLKIGKPMDAKELNATLGYKNASISASNLASSKDWFTMTPKEEGKRGSWYEITGPEEAYEYLCEDREPDFPIEDLDLFKSDEEEKRGKDNDMVEEEPLQAPDLDFTMTEAVDQEPVSLVAFGEVCTESKEATQADAFDFFDILVRIVDEVGFLTTHPGAELALNGGRLEFEVATKELSKMVTPRTRVAVMAFRIRKMKKYYQEVISDPNPGETMINRVRSDIQRLENELDVLLGLTEAVNG